MKKYTKPAIQVVELTVKESLSALPTGFSRLGMKTLSGATRKNITIYKTTSAVNNQG